MKKQKICVIGGSLTGLVTAISLSKLNCDVDIIAEDNKQNIKSSRTIAVSENNLEFLKKLNIFKSFAKYAWPCSVMEIYIENKNKEFSKVYELNKNNKKEKILYMFKNSIITQLLKDRIKKIKNISLIKNKKISSINNSGLLKSVRVKNKNIKYNLIIICTGSNSNLVKNIFNNQTIENSYKETSTTTILQHAPTKNNSARQFFLENEIFAMLPISNTKTSIVWSKKNEGNENIFKIKEKIKFYTKSYLKKIKFTSRIEKKDLNFLIRKNYYKDRILLFGDALHVIHPFVGQGFNMVLRDLISLENILLKKIGLGLDIGASDILSEFAKETKSGNFVFSISTDLLKNSFTIKNKYFKEARNRILKQIDKNDFTKNIFFNIANKGFKF